MKRLLMALALGASFVAPASVATAEMRLGVLANSGELKAQKRWAPLASYLADVLGEEVTLFPMVVTQANERVAAGEIDVMIGNPVQAATMKNLAGTRALASLVKKSGSEFAGVIVANSNAGITTSTDLRGKKVMTMPLGGAGGFMFQAAHLKDAGVTAPEDFGSHVIGKNQEDIVKLVAQGVFDAGFVRSGIIERLIAAGTLDPGQITVVDARETQGFALQHSTQLFPEWFAFASADFDPDTAARVQKALIDLDQEHAAAQAAKIIGFEAPHDLGGMEALLRQLGRMPGA